MAKKILVVDDDPTIIKTVSVKLAEAGFQVLTASDGLDAINSARKERPDLIILDVMMPELNGYDVCRVLKFDKEYKSIPILLLTARDQELDSLIGEQIGIDYLPKPLNVNALFGKIDKILGGKG